MEKVTDDSDRASLLEQEAREAAAEKIRNQLKVPSDWEGPECYVCGCEIPDARLATGAFRCIECQTKHEFNSRNRRSHYE